MMSESWHIIDRFMIHFFSSFGVYLIAYFGLRFGYRKVSWWKKWVGPMHKSRIGIVVCSIFWLGLWEGANVLSGQSYVKLWTDYLSWLVGLVAAAIAVYRYYFMVDEDIHRN